jgi:putative transposase
MPRRARLVIPGIPWHIIQRGNNRSTCFYHHSDYQYYLDTLAIQAFKHECQIHAWCLMTNHVHLLITPVQHKSAALLMKHLGQRYVQYINRSYQRSGTLWEGRFRSCLVQDDLYALACYRYIEMNPVRAGMAAHPAEYRWSSYRANGQGEKIDWLTPQAEYLALGRNKAARIRNYRRLFQAGTAPGLIDEIRSATNGNYALGSKQFRTEIARKLQTRAAPGTPGRPAGNGR